MAALWTKFSFFRMSLAAALPPFDGPCALAFASLLLAAAGVRMGATRDISMGRITAGRHCRRRTHRVPYRAFRCFGGVAIDWSRASFDSIPDDMFPIGAHDTYRGGNIPEQSGVVDRPGRRRSIPRRGRAAAPVSRTHLGSRRELGALRRWT